MKLPGLGLLSAWDHKLPVLDHLNSLTLEWWRDILGSRSLIAKFVLVKQTIWCSGQNCQIFPIYSNCPEGFECGPWKCYLWKTSLCTNASCLCLACFISSFCPYLNSSNTRIPSLAGATLCSVSWWLVAVWNVLGTNPVGWRLYRNIDRWSVHSAPGCHSCVDLHSLVIISPSNIFSRQSDRQCKQVWPCREAIDFGNSSEQFVLGAGWLNSID